MAEESPHDNGFTVAATVAVRDLVFTASQFRGTVFLVYDIQTDHIPVRGTARNQG